MQRLTTYRPASRTSSSSFTYRHTHRMCYSIGFGCLLALKRAYRKELNNMPRLANSTVIGKRVMLNCYQKARQTALRPENWPVNKQKPLRSPSLLENSNRPSTITTNLALQQTRELAEAQEPHFDQHGIWSTPHRVSNLTVQLAQLNINSVARRARCTLFRKVEKAFD